MAEKKAWTVVQFLDDHSIEVIPSGWIRKNNCYWPLYPHIKLMSAIKKCEAANHSWPTYPIRIFRNATFDDYGKARSKVHIAETTSDLQSDAETTVKRQRTDPSNASDTDEESHNGSRTGSPQSLKPNNTIDTRPDHHNQSCDEPPSPASSKSMIPDVTFDSEIPGLSNSEPYKMQPQSPIFPVLLQGAPQSFLSHNSTSGHTCINCVECRKEYEVLLTRNHMLCGLVTEVLHEIKQLRAEMHGNVQQVKVEKPSVYAAVPELKFPLSTTDELELFEALLNNEEYFNDWVAELITFGGSSNYNFVKHVLTALLTNDVALQYSWLGRKGKKSFSAMRIAKLIISAAIKGIVGSTRKETEISIQAWLRRASDRNNRTNKSF